MYDPSQSSNKIFRHHINFNSLFYLDRSLFTVFGKTEIHIDFIINRFSTSILKVRH